MKTSKFVNIILELSQVLLVFFGVYSAIMCAALSLSVPVNQPVTAVVLLGASFLFYGLFTVLETFPHGKLYGMLGISVCPDCNVAVPQCGTKGIGNDHKYIFEGIHELHPGHGDACE